MTKTTLTALALLFALGLPAAPAQAQLSRTFVSAASGNDANNCDRATPCRTFQGAHDKTNPDGEIAVLAPGGYGAVVITKSISIVNDGIGEASILVSGGATGVTVNGPADAHVNLRGLTVQGIGFGGGRGLLFSSGLSLTITNCVFRNHTEDGITFVPKVTGTSNLSIANTLVADNGSMGIHIAASLAADVVLHAVLDRVRMVNNSVDGLFAGAAFRGGAVDITVTNSVSADNGRDGFDVFVLEDNMRTTLTVIRSAAATNKGAGLRAEAGPTGIVRVGQSSVTGNGKTWDTLGGGIVQSFGDNHLAGNADGDRALPTIARK